MARPFLIGATALGVLALVAGPPATGADLVQNGQFETLTAGTVNSEFPNIGNGYGWPPLVIANWTFSAPQTGALYAPGAEDTTGASLDGYTEEVWGPGDGAANGMPADSPAGGNILMADDPVGYHTTLDQTINGLIVGKTYQLTYYWSAAEVDVPQLGIYNAPTQNQIAVSLGGQTYSTALVSIPTHGFSGWMEETDVFTATSPSEVLSFLFESPTASGAPPAALLSGVSLDGPVPEPGTWALMISGCFGLGALARRRRAAGLAALAGV